VGPRTFARVVEDAVEAFDSAWLLPPKAGEVFESVKACLRRLQGYALSRRFSCLESLYALEATVFRAWHGISHFSAPERSYSYRSTNFDSSGAAEIAANRAEKSTRAAGKRPARETTPEKSSDEDVCGARNAPNGRGRVPGRYHYNLSDKDLRAPAYRP
jgi:hypothetical protein